MTAATVMVQGGQPVPTTPLELITASDTVTQVVLGFLALLSVDQLDDHVREVDGVPAR